MLENLNEEVEQLQERLQKLRKEKRDLENVIERRIKLARARGIGSKASFVAQTVGTSIAKSHGTLYKYVSEDIVIDFDNYGGNIAIQYKDQVVYEETLNDVRLYVPGEWEKRLEALYLFAKRRQLLKEFEKLSNELENIKDKWKITDEELSENGSKKN